MKLTVLVCLCLILDIAAAVEIQNAGRGSKKESRKLFGGYRITPRLCKATKKTDISLGGPTVCMFNHECIQRDGQVVGACMDGFLFGACCELPAGISVGDLSDEDMVPISTIDNNLYQKQTATMKPQTTPIFPITSGGVSQITASLLDPHPSLLPTAQDNVVVQLNGDQYFSTTGVTHPSAPDTQIINQQDNEIDPDYFRPTNQPVMQDRDTTVKVDVFQSTPLVAISISNAPLEYTTPISGFNKPLFRPKPAKPSDNDKYVLVPTITHASQKLNKTQEYDSIVNIINMLNHTSTNRPFLSSNRPPSTSYVLSNTTAEIPGSTSIKITSLKPPSTSYVFSTTKPPRRPTTTSKKPINNKKTNPPKTKKPTTSYIYNLAPSKTTLAYSTSAFATSTRPPSSSYVYSSTPTKRPPTTTNAIIAGPGFSVTSKPVNYPSPASTVIVLGSATESQINPAFNPTTYQQQAITSPRPTAIPNRKPINHVTINNHVTQNIYSTSDRPSPTVLITPKPSISTSLRPIDDDTVEVGTIALPSPVDDVNFPPVRHPNLNMSNVASISEDDITTPIFVEDDALNADVESFVNKIIQGLQGPFHELKDIVYDRNRTTVNPVSSSTTKKPVKKQGTTTRRPVTPVTARPTRPSSTSNSIRTSTTTKPTTTKRTSTRRPVTTVATRRTTTVFPRRTKPTRKPTTTTPSYIEQPTENVAIDSEDYRTQCGIRPLMRAGRIVGGKGATFGEFPWQVLVRESTWLGLFTKNKCGGVLISHKYVMTAAHCQPGFLASLVAVFGEFDISGELESKRSISRNVKRVIVHRQYDPATFENDLALLELEQPVQFDAHIVPICLPRDGEDMTGRMATVTGWGRLKYGGGVPSVLQEVQVPIMENRVCQEMFRTAGHSKVILESFLCAGYANGQKDSCEGDSGGPLVLPRPDGRYQLAGTVSHGIKCAAPYLPGVYMRTQFFKPWITSITGVTSP